ncbi:MAG: hypothetical protein ACYDIA_25135 [Candidatus Humimicrobiaceae bacterium]
MPWCGGIATLLDEYIPKSTEITLNKFLKYIGEKIKELEDQGNKRTVPMFLHRYPRGF